MVKKVVITLAVLISIVLMFIISLSNGIRLGNFDFDNVNIQGLYLKYDKKLIVGTQSITISSDDGEKSASFKIKFGIEPFFDNYFVSVEQFLMMDPYLNISGNIVVDLDNINLAQISKTHINDFSIQFHQNLKAVHADICYVKYENDDFFFSFDNPTYADIKLDESRVAIKQYETLELELKSTDMVNSDLLSLLSNYEIELPLKQISGENSTLVHLDIPFDIEKDINAYSEIEVKNGKIELYDIPLYVKYIALTLKDNKLISKGKLFKDSKENDLQYDIDTDFVINFSDNTAKGDFFINDGKFNQLSTQTTQGEFSFDFKDQFSAAIKLQPKSILEVDEEKFYLTKAYSNYTDSDKTFNSKLDLKHTKKPLIIGINDLFNIETTTSKGDAKFLFNSEDNVVFSDTLTYKSTFEDSFKLQFNIDTMQWYRNGASYVAKNSSGVFKENKVTSVLKHIETLDGNSFLDDLKLEYFDRKVSLKKDIFKNNVNLIIDIESGNVSGDICNNDKKCPKTVKIFGNLYEDKPYIQVPRWGGEYRALDKKHVIVKIARPVFLKDYFNFLGFEDGASIYVDKKDGLDATAYIENIDFDFKAFQEQQNFGTKPGLKYDLFWENSKITYNGYHFNFKKANVISEGESKKITMTAEDGSKLDIFSDDNSLVMKSNDLSGEYINTIFQKKLINGGNIEFFMTKNTVDSYTGSVKLKEATLKDLQFVDNLLLFVNTSPAIINPLLGIPALLRFGKNKFTVDGYHVVDGEFKFVYHRSRDILEIKDIHTKGNLNNFHGNIEINLANSELKGNVNVSFLKDFASMIKYIPLVNKIILDKKEEISLPITISGTLEDAKFTVE